MERANVVPGIVIRRRWGTRWLVVPAHVLHGLSARDGMLMKHVVRNGPSMVVMANFLLPGGAGVVLLLEHDA